MGGANVKRWGCATLPRSTTKARYKLRFSIKAKNERDCVVRIGFAGWVLVLLCSVVTSATSESSTAPDARAGHAHADRARQKRDDGKGPKSRPKSYVLVGAGDIAGCSSLAGAAATAKLIAQIRSEERRVGKECRSR